jgi:DNA-binding NtrC family response regulator/tetratricopeptide (TPR) repeat protein
VTAADPSLGTPIHGGLEPRAGVAPEAAYLTDRQRLGVVLQGAGLLSLLSRAGWFLPQAWQGTTVDEDGRLGGVVASPGHAPEAPHRDLRRLLLRLFGGGRKVSGRGEGRRAARRLATRWDQILFRRNPDRLVEEILNESPWLWESRYAVARQGLIGLLDGSDQELWIAGPGRFRSALLQRTAAGADPSDLIESAEVRDLWAGAAVAEDPAEFGRRGRWREAALSWERRGVDSAEERLAYARCLYADGSFERARRVVSGLRDPGARLLRAKCQWQLGQLGAVRRSLGQLEAARFDAGQLVELADVLSRALANLGDRSGVDRWVDRALRASRGRDHLAALIVAAGASWDAGDTEAMAGHLEASESAQRDPKLAWRWHNVKALFQLERGNGRAACAHLQRAIAGSRRHLYPFQAGRLWNELGLARAHVGDLASAERAFLHACRLLTRCDAVSGLTVAQLNLAEIRVRRGRSWGVREVLERARRTDRLAKNHRGATQNAALAVRFELMHGRADQALATARQALKAIESQNDAWHRDELLVLAARALGWLGCAEEARTLLAEAGAAARKHLEAEELPALFAHAGDPVGARDLVEAGPFAPLWRRLLAGRIPDEAAWESVADVEPYRVARWIYDANRIAPGWVGAERIQQAVTTLRHVGASKPANELLRGGADPWRAVEQFLDSEEISFRRLFGHAGYPEARLIWSGADRVLVLVDATGGDEQLATPCAGGSLEVHVPRADNVLRGLLTVASQRVGQALAEIPRQGGAERVAADGAMVGRSAPLRAALARADRLAGRSIPILIQGQTGTGKELLARRIHAGSPRRDGPFVAVDCAALTPSLLQSELFGFVRGAFSGAHADRIGRFEVADGGTIFLDEIGDLPLEAQKVLLRVLQEGEVCRIGDPVPRSVDVRVLAATHHDLRIMVRRGNFRRDLYYRLRVGRVELPPLGQRGDDVLLLTRAILERESDASVPRLTRAARRKLLAHSWPGNVRELRNVLLQAIALGRTDLIRAEDLEIDDDGEADLGTYHQRVDDFRRQLVVAALEASDGNKAAAARSLGMTRQALSYLVRKLEI